MVRRLRAEREQDVAELARAVREPAQVAAGRAVAQRKLDLVDRQARADGVERHPDLAAEPGRRSGSTSRAPRRTARAAPRAARAAHDRVAQPEQSAGGPLRDPEPAALPLGECGHREIRLARQKWPKVARQVGVAQEQRTGPAAPLGERQRLALAAAGQA